MQVPDHVPVLDSLIAAAAIVYGMTLVTFGHRDMERTGISILCPWEEV